MSFFNVYRQEGKFQNVKIQLQLVKPWKNDDQCFGTNALSVQLNGCHTKQNNANRVLSQNVIYSIPWQGTGLSWGPQIWDETGMVQARNGNIDFPQEAVDAFLNGSAIVTLGIDVPNSQMSILIVEDNQILFESVWQYQDVGPIDEFHLVIVGASWFSHATFTEGIFKVTLEADQKDVLVRPREETISGCFFCETGATMGTAETSNLIEFIPKFPFWPITFFAGTNLGELIELAGSGEQHL